MKKIIFLLAAVLVVGAGCGKSLAERAAESVVEQSGSQDGVDVDIGTNSDGGNTYTFNDTKSDSNFTVGGGALPAALAADITLPADAVINSSLNIPGSVQLTYTTTTSLASAAAYHDAELQAKGWKQDANMATATTVYMIFKKGTKSIQLNAYPDTSDSSKTGVGITLFE